MATQLQPGDKVTTLEGCIDRNQHSGASGVVKGFTRFSSYHPREVWVEFEPYKGAWFWERSVIADPTPKFLNPDYVASFAA
jgi:hypothetical protein